jgi:DNA-binding GntR family transcriptional regulator
MTQTYNSGERTVPMSRSRDRAYETLRERLIGGHYAPGTQLKEEPLAAEFGISRTPVRAALRRLVDDGLASADVGQGIHVSEWNDRDIEETLQLRMLLEPYAASLAVINGNGVLVERLQESNRRMRAAIAAGTEESIAEIQEANRLFHRALMEFSGSPRLRNILETMIEMPIIVRSFYLYTPEELQQSLRHHEELTYAAQQKDGELARQVMQVHLRMSYLRVMGHRESYRAKRDS